MSAPFHEESNQISSFLVLRAVGGLSDKLRSRLKSFEKAVKSRVPLRDLRVLFPTAPLGLPDLGDQEEQVVRSAVTCSLSRTCSIYVWI